MARLTMLVRGRYLILLGLGSLVGSLVVTEALRATLLRRTPDYWLEPVFGLLFYVAVGAGLLLLARLYQVDLGDVVGVGLAGSRTWRLGLLAAPLVAVSVAGVYLLYLPLSFAAPGLVELLLLELPPVILHEGTRYPLVANVFQFLLSVGLAPLVEELAFRGFLFRRWSSKWSPGVGAVLSSSVFALAHPDLIGAWFFGLVMALIYARTRSLWAPILVHAITNALAWGIEALDLLLGGRSDPPSIAEFRSWWWLGGLCILATAPWLAWFLRRNWPAGEPPEWRTTGPGG